jgi:hypothetical protein
MSAPLRLLIPSVAVETARLLRNAALSGERLTIASGTPEHGSCVILCSGMQLKISVAGPCHVSGFKNIFCNVDQALIGSVISIELGDHLVGGEKMPAIVKSMLSAAVEIGQITNACAVMWVPAKTISGFEYFSRVIAEYNHSGIFPVLAMVNFKKESDGSICSTGLDWLADQELMVAPSMLPDSELMRRIVRVAHDLAVSGAIINDIELAGIEVDERIILRPQMAERILKMQTASGLIQ